MPHRGAVVSNAGRHAVVWEATPGRYLILPIDAGAPRTRADVAILGLSDRIACYCFGPSHVRAGVLLRVPAVGQDHTGDVSPALLALIASARARVEQDARWADKWGDDRRHRQVAREMTERG